MVLAMAQPPLHADDAKPVVPPGYELKKIGEGYMLVHKEFKASKNTIGTHSPGKYDPSTLDLNTTSSLANKSFSSGPSTLSKSDRSAQQQSYFAKPYSLDNKNSTMPNLNGKASTETASAYDRHATDSDKSFGTTGSDMTQNKKALFAANTSDYQNRPAAMEKKAEGFNTEPTVDVQKQYLGPGAQKVPKDIVIKENIVLTRMSGLPNRDLTIDEVRNLLNHDFKPDTAAKPETESKPMNDPDYKPVPLRAPPVPAEDESDNLVPPSPGAMAAPPENTEPLPQR